MRYITKGTCAHAIDFEIENGAISEIKFNGGCEGNALGIASLVKGMQVEEVIDRLQGIRCGYRDTSCPDQLAEALRKLVKKDL